MPIEKLCILHRTYVDPGSTDLQQSIYDRRAEFIGMGLYLCRQTEDWRDDARYRRVNEFSWPVRRFLQQHPERAGELSARHAGGRDGAVRAQPGPH